MRYFAWMAVPVCLALAGCGGGGGDMVEDVSAGGGGGTPPGGAGGNPPASALLFDDPLDFAPAAFNALSSSASSIMIDFNKRNALSPIVPIGGRADFEGGLLAQIGDDEVYLAGSMEVSIDLQNGLGTGTVGFMTLSGADTVNRGMDLDFLDVGLTSYSGSDFAGTIRGTVADNGSVDPDLLVSYDIDATFEAKTVGSDPTRSQMVGTLSGTIDEDAGTRQSLNGVIEGDYDLFPGF